jgi:nitroreductase
MKEGGTVMADLKDLVLKTRSYRRFEESHRVGRETLEKLLGLARCTASAANRQPLKYVLSADSETNARIFPFGATTALPHKPFFWGRLRWALGAA